MAGKRKGAARKGSSARTQAARIKQLEAELRAALKALAGKGAGRGKTPSARARSVSSPKVTWKPKPKAKAAPKAPRSSKVAKPKRAAVKPAKVAAKTPKRAAAKPAKVAAKTPNRAAAKPAKVVAKTPKRAAAKPAKVAAKTPKRAAAKTPKRAAAKPVAKKRPKLLRDDKGRFITAAEQARVKAVKKAQKEFEAKRKKEEELRRHLYPIDAKLHARLTKVIKKVGDAIETSNLDLEAKTSEQSYGSVFESVVQVEGLIPTDLSDERSVLNKQRIVVDAMQSAFEVINKAQVKRGFIVQLSLVPEETVLLQYAREKPLMTTRWMRLDDAQEVNLLVNRTRQLLKAMSDAEWDVRGVKLSFRYDREVATKLSRK